MPLFHVFKIELYYFDKKWVTIFTAANQVLLKIATKNHFNAEASILNFLKSRQIYIEKCVDVFLLHQTPLQTDT